MSSLADRVEVPARTRARVIVLPRPGAPSLLAAGLGTMLAAVAFVAAGGQRLERTTWVEIGLLLAGGGACAAGLLVPRRTADDRLHGGWALLGFTALAVLTVVSIAWSLAPADSWEEANRTFAYLATFAGAMALVRLAPERWPSVLHAVSLGCLVVCVYALLTKVYPASLAPDAVYARLREPLAYWNAVGLMAALGVPPLLWLGARRSGHAAVNALAWPGLALLLVCLMLSYSRGALVALAVGLAFWFAVVPLRLRAAFVLAGAVLGATPVVAWAFSREALSGDRILLPLRTDAGHELGAVLALMAVSLLGVGLAASFLLARRPLLERTRRRAGISALAALAVVVVAAGVALATAPGGIDGQVAKAWTQLTDPEAATPANTPDRLTATSSVRARYYAEAFDIHATSPWLGVGANAYGTARTRVRTGTLTVRHAHGYVVQTLADLGWLGLAVSLAGFGAWALAAGRATGLRLRERRQGADLPWDAERVALVTLVAVVVVFTTHSLIDWTWFVPANAVVALLCAGWVAGRRPLRDRFAADGVVVVVPTVAAAPRPAAPVYAVPGERWRPEPQRALAAAGVLLLTLAAVWATYQPLRSVHAGDAAIQRLQEGGYDAAAEIAGIAVRRNPLAVEPLWDLGLIEDARGRRQAAEAALERAVALQPANAETWRRLGRYRLSALGRPRDAVRPFEAALYLDPRAPRSREDLLEARRAVAAPPPPG